MIQRIGTSPTFWDHTKIEIDDFPRSFGCGEIMGKQGIQAMAIQIGKADYPDLEV